jgi:hypothetical protein
MWKKKKTFFLLLAFELRLAGNNTREPTRLRVVNDRRAAIVRGQKSHRLDQIFRARGYHLSVPGIS